MEEFMAFRKTSRQIITSIALLSISLSTVSCGKATDADLVGDAQACLDKATTDAAIDACSTKVSTLTGYRSDSIRCTASFLKEGFTSPSYITSVLQQLDSGSSGVNAFMGLVTFKKGGGLTTDTSTALKTFNYCLNAQGKGALIIASFGYMATALYQFFETVDTSNNAACPSVPNASTGYPLPGCVTWISANLGSVDAATFAALTVPTTGVAAAVSAQTAIGSALVATYVVSCSTSSANKTLCASLKSAIDAAGGTANQRAVAVQFIKTSLGI